MKELYLVRAKTKHGNTVFLYATWSKTNIDIDNLLSPEERGIYESEWIQFTAEECMDSYRVWKFTHGTFRKPLLLARNTIECLRWSYKKTEIKEKIKYANDY